jgi:uncharacterized LabA/DUF88 family protein
MERGNASHPMANIEIHGPVDPHLRRWMLFVDGENMTMRAQKLADNTALRLQEGAEYRKNVFVWFPGLKATPALTNTHDSPIKVQDHAIRAHYYTSLTGDDNQVMSVRQALRSLGFHPEVFKKVRQQEKAKGVDIALAKDFLSHAFLDNYDVAVLVAGDGDYVPLITEVKRLGKVVYVVFFNDYGLSTELHLAADMFFEMKHFFLERWQAVNVKASECGGADVQNPEGEATSSA